MLLLRAILDEFTVMEPTEMYPLVTVVPMIKVKTYRLLAVVGTLLKVKLVIASVVLGILNTRPLV